MRHSFLLCCLATFLSPLHADDVLNYDGKVVSEVQVSIENASPSTRDSEMTTVKESLQTKAGLPFDQREFDQDLKALYDTGEFSQISPDISVHHDALFIRITLQSHPVISKVILEGNKHFTIKKLRRELGVKTGTLFKRDQINESVNQLSDFLVKKGYYNSRVDYTVKSAPEPSGVYLYINIHEGVLAHINKIVFEGFTAKEKRELRKMIRTKRYNFLSFLTGNGIHKNEILDTDTQTVLRFMQNQGYADAKVHLEVKQQPSGLYLFISCHRGHLYHIDDINVVGSNLFDEDTLLKDLSIKKGAIFSPEEIRLSSEKIREYYTKRAYIDTTVQYKLHSVPLQNKYNVTFEVTESPQYRVGMIVIRGNKVTKKSTILHNIDLVPGEEFDSTKLQSTQKRLMGMGYYSSVSVYAVKAPNSQGHYRNVIVEVEENPTGSVNAFAGASSAQKVFGGLAISENNFDLGGLFNWSRGFSGLRGGGQFAQLRVQIGEKEVSYNASWLNPHINDSPWQFGFNASYSRSHVESKSYSIHTFDGTANISYPMTRYFRFLTKTRAKNTLLHQDSPDIKIPAADFANSGVITGFGTGLLYDSRDSSSHPHSGIYSAVEGELAGMIKKRSDVTDDSVFPFLKLSYVNALYYPMWSKGTLKGRADIKFLQALTEPTASNLPIGEKYFLGGQNSVRGYRQSSIGPQYLSPTGASAGNNPTGGVSSVLFSLEYIQNLFRSVDAFLFFDSGALSSENYALGSFKMSYGAGVSLDIGQGAPVIIGYGIPINPDSDSQVEKFFFSLGGQF